MCGAIDNTGERASRKFRYSPPADYESDPGSSDAVQDGPACPIGNGAGPR